MNKLRMSIRFNLLPSGLKVRDKDETDKILRGIANKDKWLIDGFGSLEVVFERFELAEIIIFVDYL